MPDTVRQKHYHCVMTKADVEIYFSAEKSESVFFICLGIAGIITGIVFLILKRPVLTGAALPLLAVGLIHLAVGVSVFKSCDKLRTDMLYNLDLAPGRIAHNEVPRMEKVMKNFMMLRYTEIALAMAGIGLAVAMKNEKGFWFGLGLALCAEAVISLGADYFAEKRGHVYHQHLQTFTSKMK